MIWHQNKWTVHITWERAGRTAPNVRGAVQHWACLKIPLYLRDLFIQYGKPGEFPHTPQTRNYLQGNCYRCKMWSLSIIFFYGIHQENSAESTRVNWRGNNTSCKRNPKSLLTQLSGKFRPGSVVQGEAWAGWIQILGSDLSCLLLFTATGTPLSSPSAPPGWIPPTASALTLTFFPFHITL